MAESQNPRRWKVKSSAYFGTPGVKDATNEAERKKYALEGGDVTALGDRVGRGDIAVPKNIPLGTVFYIPNYGWGVARDHGGAIVGNRIDVATGGVVGGKINPQAEKDAKQWGKKDQTVYVFPKGYQIPADRAPPQAYLNDTKNAPVATPVNKPAQPRRAPGAPIVAQVPKSLPPPMPALRQVSAVEPPVQQPMGQVFGNPQSTISQQVNADAAAEQPLVATSMNTLSPYLQMMQETDLAKKLSANIPSYNQRVG